MDDVTIANRAIARIGGIQIQSFAAPGPSGHIVPNTYTAVLEDILGKYPWHFTQKRRAPLVRTAETPNRWTYKFLLPPDRLAPPRAIWDSASSTRPFHDWEPEGNGILSNAINLWADYQWRPPVDWWPTYFRELIVMATMAELAGALREDWTLRTRLRTEVYGSEQYQGEGGQFAVATSLDAQAQPSPSIDDDHNPLTASRFTRGDARDGWDD